MCWFISYTLKGDGDMTVEAMSLMIAFATLVVLIVKSPTTVERVVYSDPIRSFSDGL